MKEPKVRETRVFMADEELGLPRSDGGTGVRYHFGSRWVGGESRAPRWVMGLLPVADTCGVRRAWKRMFDTGEDDCGVLLRSRIRGQENYSTVVYLAFN